MGPSEVPPSRPALQKRSSVVRSRSHPALQAESSVAEATQRCKKRIVGSPAAEASRTSIVSSALFVRLVHLQYQILLSP